MKQFLVAEGLMKSFRSRRAFFAPSVIAVNNVSLCLGRGECLGIVGESGSGKSTLGKLLLGLLKANAGRVLFEGQDISEISAQNMRRFRAHMALIPQNPLAALDPRMTIGSQIAEPMIFHNIPSSDHAPKLKYALDSVGLSAAVAARYPHQISGGQRQRAVIARALVLNPRLIVLDEPVSALDMSVQAQILTLLSRLQQETGAGYIFITHDLRVVRQLADRVMVMQRGEIVETGTVDEIISSPAHPYTQSLLKSVPRIPGLDGHNPADFEAWRREQ